MTYNIRTSKMSIIQTKMLSNNTLHITKVYMFRIVVFKLQAIVGFYVSQPTMMMKTCETQVIAYIK